MSRKQETTKALAGEGYDESTVSTVVARLIGGDGDGERERERETF